MWYLGLPLVIAIAVIIIISLVCPAILSGSPRPGEEMMFIPKIGYTASYLLAPFTALFFYSLEEVKGDMRIPIYIALGISVLFSMFILDMLTVHDISASILFYWVFGMPIVGAVYPATCTGFHDSGALQGIEQ